MSPADSTAAIALVAVRPISGGQVIGEADLERARLPASALPEGALTDPATAIGRTAVASIPRHGVLTNADLLTGGSLVGPGRVALPVTLGGGAALDLLRVGDRIDIIGATADGASVGVIASGVRVVAIPAPEGGMLAGSGSGRVVLIEVTPDIAARVSSAAAVSSVTFALH